jgi:hypothetical protein
MFFEQRIPNKAHAAHGALELDTVEELHLSQVWFPIIREHIREGKGLLTAQGRLGCQMKAAAA